MVSIEKYAVALCTSPIVTQSGHGHSGLSTDETASIRASCYDNGVGRCNILEIMFKYLIPLLVTKILCLAGLLNDVMTQRYYNIEKSLLD